MRFHRMDIDRNDKTEENIPREVGVGGGRGDLATNAGAYGEGNAAVG